MEDFETLYIVRNTPTITENALERIAELLEIISQQ
jgi:hypothetical protein